MTTMNNTFINALLADATYVHDLLPGQAGPGLRSALSPRMTPQLADYIASNFSVVTQVESGDFVGSGFDATVWRQTNGKLFVSMRGTEPGQDLFITDIDLAVTGTARAQIADMVNWWLRETGAAGASVRQIGYNLPRPGVSNFYEAATSSGTGRIAVADLVGGVEVNGHSLGGYLAAAFTRLFGSQAHVQHVSTFNSAGFAPGSEAVFTELQNLVGVTYGLGRFPNASEQTNYFAQNGLNLTTNNAWFTQTGNRVELFNEASTAQLPNHFMYRLSDALTLGNAISQLDPSVDIATMNTIYSAGSNRSQASIEAVFDGLLRVFKGSAIFRTTVGDDSGSAETRVAYHAALSALQDTQLFKDLKGSFVFKATDAGDLKSAARNNFGALVALQDLSPFRVSGINPAAEAKLATLWQSTRSSDYTAWVTDKGSASPTSFTDSWITDRANLLQAISARNKQDNANGLVYDVAAPLDRALAFQWFGADLLPGETQPGQSTLIYQRQGGAVSTEQHIIFGDDNPNILTGTNNKLGDHLYGGAGADTLNGQGGNDYEEGGGGFDTYQFDTAFGNDTILDSDGSGQIRIDSTTLSGGNKIGEGLWGSTDKKFIYVQQGQNLVISQRNTAGANTASGTITVKNWDFSQTGSQGTAQLGITLQGPATPVAPPAPATTFDLATKTGANTLLLADTPYSTSNLLIQNAGAALDWGTPGAPL